MTKRQLLLTEISVLIIAYITWCRLTAGEISVVQSKLLTAVAVYARLKYVPIGVNGLVTKLLVWFATPPLMLGIKPVG